jgi:hypothetical protein
MRFILKGNTLMMIKNRNKLKIDKVSLRILKILEESSDENSLATEEDLENYLKELEDENSRRK